jgi:sortase (surface protein transpeptidase)
MLGSDGAAMRRRWRLCVLLVLALALALTALPPRAEAVEPVRLSGVPVRLVIPAIEVDAEIGTFNLNDDRTMPVPQRASLVAWYTFSAWGGATGNAVLAGHRDWQRERGVFYSLGDVADGDIIWLQDADANWYLYQVVWNLALADDSAPVEEIVGPTDTATVTLITCAGAFDRSVGRYVDRRIVRAHLLDVYPAAGSEDVAAEGGS